MGADSITVHPTTRRWLTALMAGILLEYLLFFILFWDRTGPGDADQYLVFHTLQYWNAQAFGLAKQWTPLLCSGLSMAGEPQIPFMSLGMGLSYLFGPLAGVKLSLVVYCIAGWWGAYLYAGLWLRTSLQRCLAATLFLGNGFFFCRLGLGHFDFAPFLALPAMLWVLHRSLSVGSHARLAAIIIGLAAAVALMIDGSPVTILHLMLWVALYAVVLSVSTRRWVPVLVLGAAGLLAAVLDAGYLWPMVEAQSDFPRRTEDSFTSALSLLWFAILPLRGKVLPANGNGHELSVFVGPVLAWCLWRSRHWLAVQMPVDIRRPLLVVSLVSVMLGMGSLKALHVPGWLSPFDLLRPLPGFRSINATGRYWGFLALPLSLMAAAALPRVCSQLSGERRRRVLLGAVLVFQLGFQAETLSSHWVSSPRYHNSDARDYFEEPEAIQYATLNERRQQGEVLTPVTGVCDCYDMDDFLRPRILASEGPVLGVSHVAGGGRVPAVQVRFVSWSEIEIRPDCGGQGVCDFARDSVVRIVLAQAYHSDWSAPGCEVYGTPAGNLALECPVQRLLKPLRVQYRNGLSDLALGVSGTAWALWLGAVVALLLLHLVGLTSFRRYPSQISIG